MSLHCFLLELDRDFRLLLSQQKLARPLKGPAREVNEINALLFHSYSKLRKYYSRSRVSNNRIISKRP